MGPREVDDDLADLAAELAGTGFSPSQILKVIRATKGERPAPAEAQHLGYRRRVAVPRENYVTHEQVLAALAGAQDLTIEEITSQLPGANRESVQRHIGRALALGTAMQVTKTTPFRFAATAAGKALAASPSKKDTAGRGRGIPLGVVLEALRGRGPMIAQDIAAAVDGLTVVAARHAMAKGMKKGLAQQHNTHPLSWSVAGVRRTARRAMDEPTSRGTPRVRVRSLGSPLTYAEVVNKIAEIGESTAIQIHAALQTTASLSAVRQHLHAGVKEGLLVRIMNGRVASYTRKGGARARVVKPPAQKRPHSDPGTNDAAIVAAIRAAGKPLDRTGFLASSELMKNMKPQSLYNALSTAARRGFVRRVGKGLYDVAKGAKTPKEGKPSAGGKDGPAKQQDLPLESAEKKPANGNPPNGAAHAPN